MPLDDRRILSSEDAGADPDEQYRLLSQRMRRVGRAGSKPGGNNNKLIRLRTDAEAPALLAALDLAPATVNARSMNRIPDVQLAAVKPHQVWAAVQALRGQTDWAPYSPSTDYDVLLEDGVRLPPKVVFGHAASMALGFPVLPRHFSGGLGTVCFAAIEGAGFEIVTKAGLVPASKLPPTEEDRWAEGAPKLVMHMRRERARGLSKAKKSAFQDENGGRLFCEQCGCEPILEHNDALADACIEVHHRETAVAQMQEGHVTALDDLQCLCASCHRLVHARLRQAEKAALASLAHPASTSGPNV
jgi:5-methylcytosine-specific restriction protein A